MISPLDRRSDQGPTECAVRHTVSTVGHREQHAISPLRMRTEIRQTVRRLCKCPAPRKSRRGGERRKEFRREPHQFFRFLLDASITSCRDIDRIFLAADHHAMILRRANVNIWPRGFPEQRARPWAELIAVDRIGYEGITAAIGSDFF